MMFSGGVRISKSSSAAVGSPQCPLPTKRHNLHIQLNTGSKINLNPIVFSKLFSSLVNRQTRRVARMTSTLLIFQTVTSEVEFLQ